MMMREVKELKKMLEVKEFKKLSLRLEVKEFKKFLRSVGAQALRGVSLRLEVKDNTSAGEVSGETIVSNFFNFSNFSNF